ncbi:hypothetical protein CJP74_00375 [Psittacicella melopsittaci]|uniref:Flavodoxin-like fold domain-containing protein n=1 Tax=Psittacicella melopsittaci TaxID=2028576 RepID=A0A3A1YA35_9GAMM|nr:NAD(P)H-dependent oxidoreductase [Psittacicella melopsittaci]RIY34070.1 hypothetical protein CJP74_00375 [Psittacicella melopsittaci]
MLNVLVLKSTMQPNNFSQSDWLLNQALQNVVSAVENFKAQKQCFPFTYQYINLDKFNLVYQNFTPYILEKLNNQLALQDTDTKLDFSEQVNHFLDQQGLKHLVEVVEAQNCNLDVNITNFTNQTLAEFSLFYDQLLERDPAKVKFIVRDVDALPFNYTYAHLQIADQFNPIRLATRAQLAAKFTEFNWFGEQVTSGLIQEFDEYYLSRIFKPFYQANLVPVLDGKNLTRFNYSAQQDLQMYFELLNPGRQDAELQVVAQGQDQLNALFDPSYADQAFNQVYHNYLTRARVPTYNNAWDEILEQHVGFNFTRTTGKAYESKVWAIGIYEYKVNSALSRSFPETHPSLALAQANNLVNEFLQADIIIMATPVYNHAIATKLKNYLDFWVRTGVTFNTDNPEAFRQRLFPVAKRLFVLAAAGADDRYKKYLNEFFSAYCEFIGVNYEPLVYRPYSFSIPCPELDPEANNLQEKIAQQTLEQLEEVVYQGVTQYLQERTAYLGQDLSVSHQVAALNNLGPQLTPLLDLTKLPLNLPNTKEATSPFEIAAQLAHSMPEDLQDFSGIHLWGTYFRQYTPKVSKSEDLASKPDLVMHLSKASVDYIHYSLDKEQAQRSANKVRDLASITPKSAQLCANNWLQASRYPIDVLAAKDYEHVVFYASLTQYPVPEFTGSQLLAALQHQATYFKVNQGDAKVNKFVEPHALEED